MRGRPKVAVLLLLATSLALLIAAGCSSSQQQSGTNQGGSQSQSQTAPPKTLKNTLVEEWAASAHAVPITFAAEEDGCKNCHDGLTFSMTGGGFQPRVTPSSGASGSAGASGTAGGGKRDWVVATDCRSCHTGEGVKIADAGTVSGIPSVASAKGGLGALCMACHNGWHQAGVQNGEMGAPHYSVQADALFGVNTVPLVGSASTSGTANTSNQSPHLKITDTCAGCHMQTPAGAQLPSHTFLVKDFKTCQRSGCHKTDMTNGGVALQDYDGNGKKELVTVEFDNLMKQLKDAINKKAGSTDFKSEQGQVKFTGATVKGTDPAYKAAYNYFYAMNDKSKGIHNAPFIFKLLQDSLAAVK